MTDMILIPALGCQFSACADGMALSLSVPRGTFVELPECEHFPRLEYPVETSDVIRDRIGANDLT